MAIQDLFHSLAGEWTLHRDMGQHGSLEGTAWFTWTGEDTLTYREEGLLTNRAQQTFKAYRTYLYRLMDGTIHVYFDEAQPRLFHRLDFLSDGRQATAEHLCPPDLYRMLYKFLSGSEFTLHHTITGPHKNYILHSTYLKTPAKDKY